MSWQDELEQLDAELAEGRIDAQEHRRRADDLLAGASGPAPSARTWRSQSPSHNAERDTQRMPPPWERGAAVRQPQQPKSAQPASPQPASPEPQAEPVAQPSAQPPPAEPQQAQPQPAQPQQAQPQQGQPQQGQPQQAEPTPQETTNPLPKVGGTHQSAPTGPTWPAVGQPGQWQQPAGYPQPPAIESVTQHDAGKRSRNLALAGIGAGVLLLIIIAVVVWLIAFRGSPGAAAPRQQPAAPPNSTSAQATGPAEVPASLIERLPELPGTTVHAPDKQPVGAIVKDGYYSQQIADAIVKAGPKSMLLRQSVRAGNELYLLAVIPNTAQRNCQASAAAINDFQRATGLTDAEDNAFGANTSMVSRTDEHGVYYRTVYCSGRMTVIVAAASAKPNTAKSLRNQFDGFGEKAQQALPPN